MIQTVISVSLAALMLASLAWENSRGREKAPYEPDPETRKYVSGYYRKTAS